MKKISFLCAAVLMAAEMLEAVAVTNITDGIEFVYDVSEGTAKLLWAKKLIVDDHALKDVVLPEKISGVNICIIGSNAFAQAEWLRHVDVGPSVGQIESSAFIDCANLKTVRVRENGNPHLGLNAIGGECFSGCRSLESVVLPRSLYLISHAAFAGCEKLVKIDLPPCTYMIGPFAYANCKRLSEFILPVGLGDISGDAFLGCSHLRSFRSESRNFEVVDGILYHSNERILIRCPPAHASAHVKIKEGTQHIMAFAFEGCGDVREVSLPTSLRLLDDFAMSGTEISKVILPEGLERIGFAAFQGATLSEIVIPSSVAYIGRDCFKQCPNLKRIVFQGEVPHVEDETLAPSNCVLWVNRELASWRDKTTFCGCRIK